MDKFLRPERFEANPSASNAAKEWRHWYRTFSNFLSALESLTPDNLNVLFNYVAPSVYEYIADCSTYEDAIDTLQTLYVKPKNEVYARHQLATRRQQTGETLDEFLQALKRLSGDCNYEAVSAEKCKEEAIRDAFITGLLSNIIRQRLLENKTLDLPTAFDQARALEQAQKSSEAYATPSFSAAAASSSDGVDAQVTDLCQMAAVPARQQKCFFCGNNRHARRICPARDATCHKCSKKGHFSKVCRSTVFETSAALQPPTLATVSAVSTVKLSKATMKIRVHGNEVDALLDTGSSESFISKRLIDKYNFHVYSGSSTVSMASTSLSAHITGYCILNIELQGLTYSRVRMSILSNLCCDVILGQDFMRQHESISVRFGGSKPPLNVCGLASSGIQPPSLFANLTSDCKPIATKSRRYSASDRQFIGSEIERLLAEGIIEPSNSPWRHK